MFLRLLQFSFGILLCGISIAMLVRAGLGLGPWDVFHEGGAERTGLNFGTVLVLTGIADQAEIERYPFRPDEILAGVHELVG